MLLADVLGVAAPEVEVRDLAYDNRRVTDGALFFCVPGFTRDGHDFAPDAVARGAAALVVERPLGLAVPEVRVPSVREAMAPAAARFFGDPTASLPVVGVTGTNGKTTTCFLLRGLLEAAGRQTGLLGTVTSCVGGAEAPTVHTTPEAIDLQRTFRAMVEGGDAACAMEVSSHALALRRADAVHWAAAVFTNLSRDHLDFHPSMEDYFAAKRRLFEAAEGPAIVNVDDAYGRRLVEELAGRAGGVVTVALDRDADVRATDVRVDPAGSRFAVDGRQLLLRLPGRFNVANALCAIAAAGSLGLGSAAIAEALPAVGGVPGRFEPVDAGQPFGVVVDYAHTPDSLENVLRAARELTDGRVMVVFGCGGDRDRDKRPLMGAIAQRLADVAIVTSDNPRSEDPEAIAGAVLAGMDEGAECLLDRRDAIAAAVRRAGPGDVVVIAGKGHEQGQELAGGRVVPFDDRRVAREALAEHARLAG